jgi:hypothetical protein
MPEPDRKDDEKKQRLAEALRQNLRRRKDQARSKNTRSSDEAVDGEDKR